jgi:preprotein translocase subunit SecG
MEGDTNMIISPFLAVSFIMKVVAVLFVISSVILILIILVQKGRGGGLSAAFGGAMAGGLLGSKTGDFLTWVTIVLVAMFLSLAVVMAKFYRPTVSEFGTERTVQQESTADLAPPLTDANEAGITDANVVGATGVNESADANLPGG